MGIRHLARQRAAQLLYALEFIGHGDSPQDVERRFLAADKLHRRGWGPFGRQLSHQVHAHRDELDRAIAPLLRHWSLERLPVLDRICLRMALCELKYFPEIPMRVTINEYIELARMYGTDESPVYINAVLDRLAKEFPHKDFQAHNPEEDAETSADGPSQSDDPVLKPLPSARLPEREPEP